MMIEPLELEGVYLITSDARRDDRGYFVRSYDRAEFEAAGLMTNWVQDSISFNKRRDTIRGLHFQMPPRAETKLVRVTAGAIIDVAVDLRKSSLSYGKFLSVDLSADNGRALYIPAGFAHGFQTLTDDVVIAYKIDVPYDAALAGGIRWNDETLDVEWRPGTPIMSERDKGLPLLADLEIAF